jgi:hypothetical protein
MLQSTQEKIRALAESIDRGIHVAMREGRSQDVQRILEGVGKDPDIEKVIIFDPRGRILRASEPALVGRVLDRDRLSRYLNQPDFMVTQLRENGRLVHSVVKKIQNRPECSNCHGQAESVMGLLHVDMSFARTHQQIAEMEGTAVWTMLITAAVLATGGALLMVRLVERPVGRLMAAVARVQEGDLDTRAVLGTRDELGRLAENFNAMVEKLRAARAEIELYHQKRLDRAERLATLGELAASLAHEIKNPLAGIAGAVQVMAEELPEGEPRKEIMHEILSQIHRLDRTVQDLLAFARPGEPEVAPCDIHRVLDRVLLLLAENPEAKQVRVVRAYQPDLPCLQADGKQMGQVFLNLILNAVQAMPGGGSVTIATQVVNWSSRESVDQANRHRRGPSPPIHQSTNPRGEQSAWVEVAVTDTGPGIPPHILPEIFTPFISTKRRGTGLGLSVSRRIVEDHGGWIRAETENGQGATFRVFLPLNASSRKAGERLP